VEGEIMLASLTKSWIQTLGWPSARTFRACGEDATHLRTFVGLVLGGGLGFVLSLGVGAALGVTGTEFQGLAAAWVRNGTRAPWGSWQVLVPLGILSGFYSSEVFLWVIARLLGGRGSFKVQAYMQSLFYAPLALVQQVLIALPPTGRVAFALVATYSLLPTPTSLKAAHGLSTARAVVTWLIPILLTVVITAVIIALAARRG